MPTKQHRYPLKAREAKKILEETSKILKLNLEVLFGLKPNVEVVNLNSEEIYLINGKPILYKTDNRFLPTLIFTEFKNKAPKVVVDMGAIPYVCKGATVMAPGIVQMEGDFDKGDLVLIVDMKHGKALALGESLLNKETAKNNKKGPVVKTLHYVSDKIWDYIKNFST
jgi:PUA-domain protein